MVIIIVLQHPNKQGLCHTTTNISKSSKQIHHYAVLTNTNMDHNHENKHPQKKQIMQHQHKRRSCGTRAYKDHVVPKETQFCSTQINTSCTDVPIQTLIMQYPSKRRSAAPKQTCRSCTNAVPKQKQIMQHHTHPEHASPKQTHSMQYTEHRFIPHLMYEIDLSFDSRHNQ